MTQYTETQLDNINSAIQSNITKVLEQVVDPRGRGRGSSFVYQSDPRRKSANFSDYPIIYIENYGAEDINQNVGGNLFNMQMSAELHVVAEDDSARSKQWHDEVSSGIEYVFRVGQRQELAENGLSQPEIVRSQRFTGVDVVDQPVIRREIEVQANMQLDSERVNGGNPY